jgi:two-component sensor histidine kinase
LVAAVLVPLLVFAAFLLTRYAALERQRFERDAVQIAHHVALLIDGELAGYVSMLQGLATSSALAGNDFGRFYEEAKRLVEGRDEIIVLRETGERQLLNTERPLGAPLPPAVPIGAADLATLASARKLVSPVYASPLSGEPRVAVAVPVVKSETPFYVLAITFPTIRIRDALVRAVPANWIVTVGDQRGTIVTRSVRHEDVSGKPGLPEYLSRAVGRSGTFTSKSFEGTTLLAGYYRSEFADWLFGANIPEAVVAAPLWRSLIALLAIGSVALALSAMLAFLFGATFTAAAAGLADRAAALGEGRSVSPLPSRVSEFALVGQSLAQAAAAIEHRNEERERGERQRELLVNELNHRVKNTLATVQSIVLQTMRGSTSMTQAGAAIGDRLMALSQVHDVLTRENWAGAELDTIVRDMARPHGGSERVRSVGASVWLPPSLSLSLALALHELATNASKYGSLSKEGGFVTLEWEVLRAPDGARLRVRWSESGGPPVTPPAREGFGTRLIQRNLAPAIGGNVVVEYRLEGLVCVIEVPLKSEAAAAATPPSAEG